MAIQDVIAQLNEFNVNDIDWTRMGVWPVAGKVVFCLLLVAAIVAGGYFVFIKDLNLQLEKVQGQEQKLRADFKKKAHQAANLDAYREQMVEMEESFGALVAQLPSDTEVPGLLEDIDEKGVTSGLQIKSIVLQPERRREYYVELPIEIKVRGPYHDLGVFVSGVAGMPRIVTLHNYEIGKGSGAMLDMTIEARTYRYRDQEGK
ncbi:type 4a pilus biogenesis protein PilO [Pseudomaricurvus sp. HS19]|uniref:type 4a pilus biogenesis protein PilO n=1 Tax=Pseudomaricurvus sp. HS19 TaxID=2692626 RepID=UPI00136F0B3C|nr:type 4a pilus biogenesis protein PilO [Pseudomaricurvus sp. HS19]MYM63578.1 type 4a pilus biogenesis protein PilO [Pseudomaricurvus sp. HS19]